MCVEFRSKSNSIGEGIGEAIRDAIGKAEAEGWNGVVIGNNATNFSVGANLMPVGMMAMQKQYDKLDEMVNGCLLYTSPSPRDATLSRMPSSA